ncbi:MAG TPA: hypothetical protein VJN02_09870 [Gammaproteobacteria bacterium]|nr:hypothetical protein [Gammaproteobacteria bacterium]
MTIEKQYFTLEEAAKEQECDIKSILHAIETEKIRPAVYIDKMPVLLYEVVTVNDADYIIKIAHGYFSGIGYVPLESGLELIKNGKSILEFIYPSNIGHFYKEGVTPSNYKNFSSFEDDSDEPNKRFISDKFDKSQNLREINYFEWNLHILDGSTKRNLADSERMPLWWETNSNLLPLDDHERKRWKELQKKAHQARSEKNESREHIEEMRLLKEKIQRMIHEKLWKQVKSKCQLRSIMYRLGDVVSVNRMKGLYCFRTVPVKVKLLDLIKNEKYVFPNVRGLDERYNIHRAYSYDFSNLVISKENLVITKEQLDKINSPINNNDYKPPKHMTEAMALMYQAIEKFWVNYDPASPPKADAIKKWLIEQGATQRIATAIDTLMRPAPCKKGGNKRQSKSTAK